MAAYRRVYDSRHLQADCQEERDQLRDPIRSAVEYGLPLPFMDMDAKFHIRGKRDNQVHRAVHCGPESVDTTVRRRLESVRRVVLLDAHTDTHTHTHDGLSRRGRHIPTSSVRLAMGKQTNARGARSAADVASPHHRPSCSNRVLPGLPLGDNSCCAPLLESRYGI